MWCSSFVLFFDVGVVKIVLFLPCSLAFLHCPLIPYLTPSFCLMILVASLSLLYVLFFEVNK